MKKTKIFGKKSISVALALLLAMPATVAALAENGTDSVFSSSEADMGQINVSVSPEPGAEEAVEFSAELSRGGKTLDKGADNGEVSFTNLADGDYTLKVSVKGFADYEQEISVEQQAVSVKLMTDAATDYYGNAYPGVLVIGDVNNDGVVDDDDREQLTDAIDGGSSDGLTDLNGDGEFNLVDLEYLAKGYNVTADKAVPEVTIPEGVITTNAGENTDADFAEDGSIKLTPKSGEISAENPVTLELDINKSGAVSHADGIVIGVSKDNPIDKADMDITYTDADNNEYTVNVPFKKGVDFLLNTEEVTVLQDGQGNIHINLGSQIAIKKVTFKISGMTKDSTLAEISTVEFVNGMENKIPEPATDIPENLSATAGDKSFVLKWKSCVNVTGYEVMITQGNTTEIKRVTGNSLSVSSLKDKKLSNGTEYTVKVQSINGTWSSGYCEAITVTPKATKKPDRPDGVSAVGGYRSIAVSWKKAEDAEWYNVYYKLRSDSTFTKIEKIKGTSYTISNLEDKSEYQVYVTAENEIGASGASLTATATTTDINPPTMPKYNLINTGEKGEVGQHIISASQNGGTTVGSNVDEEGAKTAWATVDHDPDSYYIRNTWDDGGFNAIGNKGLFYEFDEEYTIQSFALYEAVPNSLNLFYCKVNYWDAAGNRTSLSGVSISKKADSEGRAYYLIKLPKKAQIKRIQIGLARYLASGNINVSEIYFYHYDTVIDDIAALYADDLHLVLKPEVTQATIDALRTRINTPDPACGEYNPDREMLERELKNAEDILNCVNLGDPVYIHNEISTSDVGRGFSGLNAWQPIGVTAAAGETITVYVGHNTKATGAATNLQLVATQYHAESGALAKTVATLKVGSNVIEIPKIWSIDAESGGALYIQYTGSNANDRYAVRVSGGVKVPVLDLYGIEDESEKLARAETYMEELSQYVSKMAELHAKYHTATANKNVNKYDYSAQNCVLGASDILLDNMLLSLPASRILAGAGQGSAAERAARVVKSADAMEDMLYLFYQHKGLNDGAANEVDRLSKRHLNIRYQRMFSGAFMYAAGNHIGIEWGSCSGVVSASGVVSDENGKYISGRYFGWGIAHEIGHCINQGTYAVAEITNNYFAQLAQAKDSNSNGMRFTYPNIYNKVTSGAVGQASNVFTQLGMYWQLHLAYDNDYNYKTYDDRTEQLESLFFARVDSYARTPSSAPAPGGVALTLNGGTDQSIMRLACAAAEKNVLEFFERWGKTPDSTTKAYAEQFEKEERAIYYGDDNSRVYRIENPNVGYLGTSGDVSAVGADTTAVLAGENSYQVNFTLSSENIPASELLGYEIVRCTTSGGKVDRQVVGFTTTNTFTDSAAGLNNRVVTYEVIVVDKYLYRSAPKTLEPIKIQDDGSLDKTWWTISGTGITAQNTPDAGEGDDDMPCAPTADDPILLAIDGNNSTEYIGKLSANAEIILEFNRPETISGFKYTAGGGTAVEDYTVMVRAEDGTWQTAASGVLGGNKTVYFENADRKYVSTYNTTAIKLVISGQAGQKISIAELDVLGVTGDNVDFRRTTEGTAAIGVLSQDYKYGDKDTDVISAGSIVFTGAYKGSPAYNVVMLFDQDGNVVGGFDSEGYLKAQQIILADDPGSGLIQDVSDGTWIYWIDPSDDALEGITQVRAELYRVNDALTNEGERLVSDSLFTDFPKDLPEISFSGDFEG